ncbi:MAG TPA: hypothetical protein VIO60_05860, partial [Rectinemataceae bacterium]
MSQGGEDISRAFAEDSPGLPESDPELACEIVLIHVYDIGRSVDLKKAAGYIPAYPDIGFGKRRDTPSYLTLPKPLVLTLNTQDCDAPCLERFSAQAKIYDDGALTLVLRYRLSSRFGELADKVNLPLRSQPGSETIQEFADSSFQMVVNAIKDAVAGLKQDWNFD